MIQRYLFALLLVFGASQANSQNLYFYMNDASMQMYAISEVSYMKFDATSIKLHLTDESIVSFDLEALNNYRYTPDNVTSIEQAAENPQLSFFPNPAEQQLNLRFSLPKADANTKVLIHNLKGEMLLEQEVKSHAKGELTLDLSKLAAGQYFCTLESGKVVISKAFMKR